MDKIDNFSGEYSFLSNFYYSPITYGHLTYPTSEHAFQAAKTEDKADELKIQKASTPGQAKKLGRKVTLIEDWERDKRRIMKSVLRRKFKNLELSIRLKQTGDAELIEGNTWGDTYWGVCKGKGKNHLGKLLMDVRAELRLKSCPFCGGKGSIHEYNRYTYVICEVCGAKAGGFDNMIDEDDDENYDPARKAVIAWEKRSNGLKL